MNAELSEFASFLIACAIIMFLCIILPIIHFGRKKDEDIENHTGKGALKIIIYFLIIMAIAGILVYQILKA